MRPKHLWSGDWERESAAVSDELANLVELPRVYAPDRLEPVAPPIPRPKPARPRPKRRRGVRVPRPSRALQRGLAVAIVALLVLAGAAYGLSALLGGSSSSSPAAVTGPTGPIRWLGMEIETQSPSGVVVATVDSGSQGELAGLEPGDVILQVNNRSVNATGEIAKAIKGMRAGQSVQIEISRGSTLYNTSATLGPPPSNYP